MSEISKARKRTVTSLFSISVDTVVLNLRLFSKNWNCLKYLPMHAKDKILTKILSHSSYRRGLNFNEMLQALAHKQLANIDLQSVEIDDFTLKVLEDCPNLKELYLKDCCGTSVTSEGLRRLFEKTRYLEVLDITRSAQFNDEILQCLTDHSNELFGLHIEGCDITDYGLIYLTAKHRNLRYLTVSKTKISGEGLSKAVLKDNLRVLRELRIDDCPEVTDHVLKDIVVCCPELEILTFYNCSITDETALFQNITGACKNLKQLHWTIKW